MYTICILCDEPQIGGTICKNCFNESGHLVSVFSIPQLNRFINDSVRANNEPKRTFFQDLANHLALITPTEPVKMELDDGQISVSPEVKLDKSAWQVACQAIRKINSRITTGQECVIPEALPQDPMTLLTGQTDSSGWYCGWSEPELPADRSIARCDLHKAHAVYQELVDREPAEQKQYLDDLPEDLTKLLSSEMVHFYFDGFYFIFSGYPDSPGYDLFNAPRDPDDPPIEETSPVPEPTKKVDPYENTRKEVEASRCLKALYDFCLDKPEIEYDAQALKDYLFFMSFNGKIGDQVAERFYEALQENSLLFIKQHFALIRKEVLATL